jgi:hypothetical protein
MSISQLIKNSSVPMEPDILEMSAEESGISISLDGKGDDDDESGVLDPLERSGFEFEFTDNEEPTEEQSDAERKLMPRQKSILDAPAGIPLFDDTSNERPARLISDSFDLEKKIEPKIAKAETKAKPPPVRPVSLAEPPDIRTSHPDDLPAPVPARAKGSKESALRRVVQRHKVAKEVRARGTPGEVPAPMAASMDTSPAPPVVAPSPAKPSRAVPSAGQFYPPVQQADPRATGALNKFATFAVLIAVLLAVAAAVSILLQNRPRAIPPISEATEIKPDPAKAPALEKEVKPPPAPPAPPVPPPVKPPPPPPVQKLVKPVPPAPPPPIEKQPDPPAKKKPVVAAEKKKKKSARPKTDKGVLRISCDKPIDIKISSVGTVKQKTKYGRQLKPGDYRITLVDGAQRKSYDIILVPGDPVVIRCPF